MRTRRLGISGFLAAVLLVCVTGCGKETVNSVPPAAGFTTPANGAINVPVNQVVSVTFSEPMNQASINNTTFTLTGPGNVNVLGSVNYSATTSIATFTPNVNLAYNTTYTATINTGVMNTFGVEPAANLSWTFTTAVQPTVIATVPANGATGVPLNQILSVTFSKAVNCATLNSPATSFQLTGPGTTTVAGTVACVGVTATFTPTLPLLVNTLYTATITTAATDVAGDPLAANYVWTFRTVPAAPTAPAVISTAPANGATSVPTSQAVTATFNEAMNPATINGTTFTLKLGGVAVTGVVTYTAAGSVATFTPAVPLAVGTYTATITTGAMDLSGNSLAANYVWTFTVVATPDTTRPRVIATIPANAAVNVPANQVLSATFSKAMSAATINTTTFTLTGPGPGTTSVTGQVVYSSVSNTATFTPAANLAAGVYTATITTGAADLSGNTLAANFVWTFTVVATLDVIRPLIVSTVPINGAINVPANQAISASFSEPMNPQTITTATFTLTGPGAVQIAGVVSYDPIGFIATFTPTANLAVGIYTANITSGATDLAGNSLGTTGAPNPWTFTVSAIVVPPVIDLGTAALFGDFGGVSGMTNSGTSTVVNGNIGTTAASTLIVDFHDLTVVTGGVPECSYTETTGFGSGGLVNGTIDTAPGTSIPTAACPNEGTAVTAAIALKAGQDALAAYGILAAIPGGLAVETCAGCGGIGGGAGELGNRTLAPGVYKSTPGTYAITTGPLTLNANGDPNAIWVFQMSSALTVGTSSANQSVLLTGGAQAKNVYWQAATGATINGILGGGTMVGTIIAQTGGISVSTAGVAAITTINGRLLSLSSIVTIVNTVINVPAP